MKKIILALLVIVFVLLVLGVYKFNYLSNKDGYNVDGNRTEQIEELEESEEVVLEDKIGESINETMAIRIPLMKTVLAEQFPKVIYIEQEVSKKESVLDSVYTTLFSLGIKPTDDDTVHNHVFNSGLEFDSVSINDGQAFVKLTGQYMEMHMGNDSFRKQINSSAFQYDTVDGVTVYLNGELFDWCITDLSGGEGGCPEESQYWIDTREEYNSYFE